MVWDTQNCASMVHFSKACKKISDCLGGVWSKSSISQKIVPTNRNSKSMDGKHFTNVRWGANVVSGAIAWSKLKQICVLLPFVCHFLDKRFHTLKFQEDFFSRQGEWSLYCSGVYHGLLLTEKYRWSCWQNGNNFHH